MVLGNLRQEVQIFLRHPGLYSSELPNHANKPSNSIKSCKVTIWKIVVVKGINAYSGVFHWLVNIAHVFLCLLFFQRNAQ